jgi:hypothetical protein
MVLGIGTIDAAPAPLPAGSNVGTIAANGAIGQEWCRTISGNGARDTCFY